MIEIKASITIVIDGPDVQILSNICEVARVYFDNTGERQRSFSKEEVAAMTRMMSMIFDRHQVRATVHKSGCPGV